MGYKFGKVANFGIGNTLTPTTDSSNSIVMGTGNTATSLKDSVVIGSGNTMKSGTNNTYALGDTNDFSDLGSLVHNALAYTVGYGNTMKDAGVGIGILSTLEGYGGTCVGYEAIAKGQYSTCVGYSSNASGNYSLALGNSALASAETAMAFGDATVSGVGSIGIGGNSAATTSGAVAIGRYARSTTNRNGSIALCTYPDTTLNFRKGFGKVQTTDATQTILYLNNAGSSDGAITCVESQVLAFDIVVTGKKSDNTEGAMFRLEGACRRASGGNITLIGSVTKTVLCRDDSNWDVAATVDTGTQSLQVKVTGVAATTIDWFATLNFHEIGN